MTRPVYDDTFQVHFVATISNIAAPTVAEIAAGDDLTAWMPKNGFNPNHSTNEVANDDLSSSFDAKGAGTWGAKLDLTLYRETAADAAWELFPRGTTGYIVVVPFPGAAVSANDVAHVYPIETNQRSLMASAANEKQKFTVSCSVTSEPNLDAIVAA